MYRNINKMNGRRKHAKFGIISLTICGFTFLLAIYLIYQFSLSLMANPELLKNPAAINGMPVPESVMYIISFLLIIQCAGFLSGIIGLMEKHKRKLLAIIGIFLNGIFLFFTLSKVI